MPRASVIVCVFNREDAISDCLVSLATQSFVDFELIVVDDGSTDGTPTILERFRRDHASMAIRVLTNPSNLGISAARNVGLAEVRGEIVLFTDSDCVADPTWVEAHLGGFEEREVVATGGAVVDAAPRNLTERTYAGTSRTGVSPTQGRILVGNNMAFRHEILLAYGFDPALSYYCDEDDLAWRLQSDGHQLRYMPNARVQHRHRLAFRAYMRMAKLQGQGSARHWYKKGTYVGRDVVLVLAAAVAALASVVFPPLLAVAAALLLTQLAVLSFAEIAYKGKSLHQAAISLPVAVLYNLRKTASVGATLLRIVLGREPAIRRSRREWRSR